MFKVADDRQTAVLTAETGKEVAMEAIPCSDCSLCNVREVCASDLIDMARCTPFTRPDGQEIVWRAKSCSK